MAQPHESRYSRPPHGWRAVLQRCTPATLAEQSPRLYQTLLNMLGSIGYLVIFGLPILCLVLAIYLGVILLGAPPAHWNGSAVLLTGGGFLLAAWSCLVLYRARPDAPAGIPIHREHAPDLYAMMERRTAKFRASQIHNVLLTEDHQIRVYRTPRNGYLLQTNNTLCIGAPILHLLSRRQFRIALRCAIGQFSHYRDPNLGEMVFMAEHWQQLRQCLRNQKSPGAWALRGIAAVYIPLLEWFSLPAARQHALNHDLYGTEIAPDEEMLAIIAAEVVAQAYLLHSFWPMLMKIANHKANPSVRPFSNFEPMVQQTLGKKDAERWLLQAITAPEDPHSSSPSLRTRVGALGYAELEFSSLPEDSAIQLVLGDASGTLLNKLDHSWRENIRVEWKQRHVQYRQEQERFEKLHQRFHDSNLEGEAAIKYANMARKYLHQGEAIEVYTHLQEYNQNNPEVVFQMGKLLLEAGQSRGMHAIEQAVAMDKRFSSKASVIMSNFMMDQKTGTLVNSIDKSNQPLRRRKDKHQDTA